ncbi:MAG: hypothetical protein WA140_01615 [Geobacteraceae bacterium]
MEHAIRPAHNDNIRDVVLAGIFSFVLHLLLYAVLASTSIFFPPTGEAEKLEVHWFYPALLFGSRSEPVVQTVPQTLQEQAQAAAPVELPAAIAAHSEKKKEIPPVAPPAPTATIPQLSPPKAREITPEPRHSEAPEAVDTLGDQEMKYPVGPGTVKGTGERPDEKAVLTAVKSPPPPTETEQKAAKTAKEQPLPRSADAQPTEPPVVEKKSVKTFSKIVPPSPVADIRQNADKIDQPLTPPTQPQVSVAPDRRKTMAEAAPLTKPLPPVPTGSVSEQRAATTTTTTTPTKAAAPLADKTDRQTIAKVSPPAPVIAPKEETKNRPITNPPPVKAVLAAPPIAGDLKLEISATPEGLKGVKVIVLFREYPKNRHNRPQTRTEFGQAELLIPKLARPGKNILQAVIEIAGEGIYDFRAELADGKHPVEAGLAVKFFENSAKASARKIADRKVLDNGSVAKILMPECILWDDDAYFSGNMEDSGSVTKFNSETGVVWKEYK